NPVHLLFIAAVALVVLGPKRLPGLAKALGHGIREFREAISSGEDDEPVTPPAVATALAPPPAPAGAPATAQAAPTAPAGAPASGQAATAQGGPESPAAQPAAND
ncbi:MAG: hypothetical protein JWM60_1407, partial [Solirubrobacterales bacterium]|nr:hypothetical protein [Solirubrobacterales bacterium]